MILHISLLSVSPVLVIEEARAKLIDDIMNICISVA